MFLILLLICKHVYGLRLSYNLPNLCSNALWNQTGIIYADNQIVGSSPFSIFVDNNNTLYATSWESNEILKWFEKPNELKKMNSAILIEPPGLFVSITGDVYINHVYDDFNDHLDLNITDTDRSLSDSKGLFHSDSKLAAECKNWGKHKNKDYYDYFKTLIDCGSERGDPCEKYKSNIWKTWEKFCGRKKCLEEKKRSKTDRKRSPSMTSINQSKDNTIESVDDDTSLYEDGIISSRVYRLSSNTKNNSLLMTINGSCASLFIIGNTIYCSITDHHQIVKKSLNSSSQLIKIVAGNGSNGSTSDTLNYPQGIFVDTNFGLYVADSENHRIQYFPVNESSGKTIVRNETMQLWWPTGITLDANKSLYIVDRGNKRIVRFTTGILQCILGCGDDIDSVFNKMFDPHSLWFDSYGNIFVSDWGNDRIVKFYLKTNCYNNVVTSSTMSSVTMTVKKNYSDLSSTCKTQKPCQNGGSCIDNGTDVVGYSCLCVSHFNGDRCEHDHRPCKPDTCWNNGECVPMSNSTFKCHCPLGWEGDHCQTQINNCTNNKCLNNGVCYPLLMNYTCKCLGDSYFGRHCEKTALKIIIFKIVSRSWAYVSIFILTSIVMFIVIMDILKYGFGIDPVHEERERIRQEKREKNRKPIIQRFHYVNKQPTLDQLSTTATEETST